MAHEKLMASERKSEGSASTFDPITGRKITEQQRQDNGMLMKLVREGYTKEIIKSNNNNNTSKDGEKQGKNKTVGKKTSTVEKVGKKVKLNEENKDNSKQKGKGKKGSKTKT